MFVDLFDHTSSHQWSLAVPVRWHAQELKTCLHDDDEARARARALAKQLNNLRTESDYMDFRMIASHANLDSTSPPPEQIILHDYVECMHSIVTGIMLARFN